VYNVKNGIGGVKAEEEGFLFKEFDNLEDDYAQ
jgi:hypothetical protein